VVALAPERSVGQELEGNNSGKVHDATLACCLPVGTVPSPDQGLSVTGKSGDATEDAFLSGLKSSARSGLLRIGFDR
jgi:hypothetical protein